MMLKTLVDRQIMAKVIARIKGGLGNQLFCYAAARRLALVNGADLMLDDVTGFARDYQYRRRYALDHFNIMARKATPAERLEPFERLRRGVARAISRRLPFERRMYLEQEGWPLTRASWNIPCEERSTWMDTGKVRSTSRTSRM